MLPNVVLAVRVLASVLFYQLPSGIYTLPFKWLTLFCWYFAWISISQALTCLHTRPLDIPPTFYIFWYLHSQAFGTLLGDFISEWSNWKLSTSVEWFLVTMFLNNGPQLKLSVWLFSCLWPKDDKLCRTVTSKHYWIIK